jgi:predicted nucleic acid-binding protein
VAAASSTALVRLATYDGSAGTLVDAIDALLNVYDTRRSTLPWACAALAAQAYALYRQRGGGRTRPLPDFYIGAHAAVANLSVLTRDRAGYASYFPRLAVIAPNPEAS